MIGEDNATVSPSPEQGTFLACRAHRTEASSGGSSTETKCPSSMASSVCTATVVAHGDVRARRSRNQS